MEKKFINEIIAGESIGLVQKYVIKKKKKNFIFISIY